MVTWDKDGNMIIIDGEEENRLLCEYFKCSPEIAKSLSIVKASDRIGTDYSKNLKK